MTEGVPFTTRAPFSKTKILIFDNQLIPVNHIARMTDVKKQETLLRKLSEKDGTLVVSNDRQYIKSPGGTGYKYLTNKKGVRNLLQFHFRWSKEDVESGMTQLFKKRERPPPVRQEEEEYRIEKMLKTHLDEVDARMGQNALWAYTKTEKFKTKVATAVQEEVEKLRPEFERRLEETLRSEVMDKLQVKVNEEAEALKLKMRSKAAKSLFIMNDRDKEGEAAHGDELWGNIKF